MENTGSGQEFGEVVAPLLTPEGRVNPYPIYAAIREIAPFAPAGEGVFVATGYEVIDAVLRDARMQVQGAARLDVVAPGWEASRAVRSMARSVLFANAPDHTRVRRLASGVFTARRVGELRETIAGQVATQTDALARALTTQSSVDFLSEFAFPLPIAVICALLGLPAEDHTWFRSRAAALTVVLELTAAAGDLDEADAATGELEDYFSDLIVRRRRDPREDLTTALVRSHDADGSTLTGAELLANLILLLVAGFETTTNLLGNGLVTLLREPEWAARLRSDDTLAPAFVEEIARFDSPVQLTSRWCPDSLEIGGVSVPAGAEILLLIGAGNRDPGTFTDPDSFDPGRYLGSSSDSAPLSFGAGAHFCLGSPLARLEAQLAFPALFRALPDLRLAVDPPRRDRLTLRGYAEVSVTTG